MMADSDDELEEKDKTGFLNVPLGNRSHEATSPSSIVSSARTSITD